MKKTTKRKTTSKRGKNSKGVAKLRKITAEAKRIHKANPRKKWTTCMKDAAKKVK